MTLIDLGEVGTATSGPVGAVPLHPPRPSRLVLAVVAVLGLLTLTAAAPPGPPLVHPVWSVDFRPSDTMTLDGSTAYLNRVGADGTVRVTAHDLATGRVRWTAATGGSVADYGVWPAGDVLLVPTDPPGAGRGAVNGAAAVYQLRRDTIALDAATGRQLWRSTGDAAPSVAAGTLLLAETNLSGAIVALRLVGLRDGHQVWRRPIRAAEQWAVTNRDGRPAEIGTVTGTGDVTVYGYPDGAVRHRGHLRWTGTDSATLSSVGPYFVVSRTAATQTAATVYRPADLRPLWRSDDPAAYVTECGTLICTVGLRGVVGRDPATGRERWRRPGTTGLRDLGEGRLTLRTDDPDTSALVLVDAATGRTIGGPLTGQQAYSEHPSGALFVLRASASPAGRTAVSRLDLADGRQTLLGTVDRPGEQDCSAAPGYLACPHDGTLTVTAAG